MSPQKRALPFAASSSGQASLFKKPHTVRSKRNHTLMWLEKLVRGWVRKEFRKEFRQFRKQWECDESDSAENHQRCTGDAWVRSTENAVQEPTEAVELANIHFSPLARGIAKSTVKNDARNLRLQFNNKLSLPVYTGMKLEGEGGTSITVALIDVDAGNIVTSGSESSIKLDVVVLEGDFNGHDEDDWPREEFDNCVVKPRRGKPQLLEGDAQVTLKGGVGQLKELKFTDNSSWNRSKSFRIGLKVASGYHESARIREAKTEAFPVKWRRGLSNQKHYPPNSSDEVWLLDNIAKHGPTHRRLNEAGINTVEELLRRHSADCHELRKIFGDHMTQKKWDELIKHAETCIENGKLYVYYPDKESHRGVRVNNVGRCTDLIEDGLYCPAARFSPQQKDDAARLVTKACKNWKDVREFNAEASSSSMSEKISNPFPPEALGDRQIHHDNMNPPRMAAPVGSAVPPENSPCTAKGNHGITGGQLPTESQCVNPQIATLNLMEPSVDTNVQPPGQQRGSPSSFPPSRNTAAGFPRQAQGLNPQNATSNQNTDCFYRMEPSVPASRNRGITGGQLPTEQSVNPVIATLNLMEPSVDTNVQPLEQQRGSPSSFLASRNTAAGFPRQAQGLNPQDATSNQNTDCFYHMEPSVPASRNRGITGGQLPTESQSVNPVIATLNLMEPSVDTNVQPLEQQRGSPSSFLASRNTAAGFPRQAQGLNPQNATLNQNTDCFYQMEPSVPASRNRGITGGQLLTESQSVNPVIATLNLMEPSVDTNVQPLEQMRGSPLSFLASRNTAVGFPRQAQGLNPQNFTSSQNTDCFYQMEPSVAASKNRGITGGQLLTESQSVNPVIATLNLMEPSVDTNVQPLEQLRGSPSSFLSSRNTAAGFPRQAQGLNPQNAMWNQNTDCFYQMEPSVPASRSTAAGFPRQAQGLNPQNATSNLNTDCFYQMVPSVPASRNTAPGFPRQAQDLNPQNATSNQNTDCFYQMEPSVPASRNTAAGFRRQAQGLNPQNATSNQNTDYFYQMVPLVQASRNAADGFPRQAQGLYPQNATSNQNTDYFYQMEPSVLASRNTAAGFPRQAQGLNPQNATSNQNTDCFYQMEPAVPASRNWGTNAPQLQIQSESLNPQNATLNQMGPPADTNVQPLRHLYRSTSGFLALNTEDGQDDWEQFLESPNC